MLAPTLRHGQRVMKKMSVTSGLYPRSDGSSQGSLETFASHFEVSWTTSSPKLEAPLSGLDNRGPLVGELHNRWR